MENQDLAVLRREVFAAVSELLEKSGLESGQILVVGCSTSEVMGERIGAAGSVEVARALLEEILGLTRPRGIQVAVQCCEHLNRALVVEKSLLREERLEQVAAYPVPKAGGAMAAQAMLLFEEPVLAESIKAHAAIDIGETLIGMHLRAVAVPVRLGQKTVGQARVTAARTRPRLIGGERARYGPCSF